MTIPKSSKEQFQPTSDHTAEAPSAPQNRRKTGEGAVAGGEAYRFKTGQSGNPGGRPKMGALARACRNLLESPVPGDRKGRTYAEAIAERLAEFALKGHMPSIRELADRAEGRAGQSLEIAIGRTDAGDVPLGASAVESPSDRRPELQAEASDSETISRREVREPKP